MDTEVEELTGTHFEVQGSIKQGGFGESDSQSGKWITLTSSSSVDKNEEEKEISNIREWIKAYKSRMGKHFSEFRILRVTEKVTKTTEIIDD